MRTNKDNTASVFNCRVFSLLLLMCLILNSHIIAFHAQKHVHVAHNARARAHTHRNIYSSLILQRTLIVVSGKFSVAANSHLLGLET